jgi:uncharacterized membrane protein
VNVMWDGGSASEHLENQAAVTMSKGGRLFPLDALRGLIMVLMALDHANDFVAQKHPIREMWGGGFPAYSGALAFLTRLVTHPAASGFFFLMGAGMVLFTHSRRKGGWSRWAITRHFLIRGVLLMALQFLVVNRAWELSPGGWEPSVYAGVLFALGGTMILGSLLLWLKPGYLLVLTVVLVLGTEFLHPDPSLWEQIEFVTRTDKLNLLLIYPGGTINLWSNYPILPWLELVTFGMVFGYRLRDDRQKAFDRALKLGGAFLLAFAVVRYLDGFGNIRPRMGNSWIDLLNVVKYPPSMVFTLLTTGVNLILLGLFAQVRTKGQQLFQALVVFGQVPLFFYLVHLSLYARLGLWLTPEGTSILAMYPLWLLGLVFLYPLCLWYGRLKHRQPANSILRFL